MSRCLVFTIALLLLASCAPMTIYHRPGVAVQRMQTDLLSCEVDALDKAPVASQIRQGPPMYIPGRRYCNSDGHCHHRGGYYVPGDVYTVDPNAGLRRRLETQCMAGKGYQKVQLPDCTGPQPNVTQSQAMTVLPPLTPESCVVRNRDKSWRIVPPAG